MSRFQRLNHNFSHRAPGAVGNASDSSFSGIRGFMSHTPSADNHSAPVYRSRPVQHSFSANVYSSLSHSNLISRCQQLSASISASISTSASTSTSPPVTFSTSDASGTRVAAWATAIPFIDRSSPRRCSGSVGHLFTQRYLTDSCPQPAFPWVSAAVVSDSCRVEESVESICSGAEWSVVEGVESGNLSEVASEGDDESGDLSEVASVDGVDGVESGDLSEVCPAAVVLSSAEEVKPRWVPPVILRLPPPPTNDDSFKDYDTCSDESSGSASGSAVHEDEDWRVEMAKLLRECDELVRRPQHDLKMMEALERRSRKYTDDFDDSMSLYTASTISFETISDDSPSDYEHVPVVEPCYKFDFDPDFAPVTPPPAVRVVKLSRKPKYSVADVKLTFPIPIPQFPDLDESIPYLAPPVTPSHSVSAISEDSVLQLCDPPSPIVVPGAFPTVLDDPFVSLRSCSFASVFASEEAIPSSQATSWIRKMAVPAAVTAIGVGLWCLSKWL